MTGPVIVDANPLLLLIVGSTDLKYISVHKNLSDYSESDFEILGLAISVFSDIVLIPHVMAEVSSLARQTKNPARARIQSKLRDLVETTGELPMTSLDGVRRDEFETFGLTDAIILQACSLFQNDLDVWLLTADKKLAVVAEMLGYGVTNFSRLR